MATFLNSVLIATSGVITHSIGRAGLSNAFGDGLYLFPPSVLFMAPAIARRTREQQEDDMNGDKDEFEAETEDAETETPDTIVEDGDSKVRKKILNRETFTTTSFPTALTLPLRC